MIIIELLLLVLGFAMLVKGADWLRRSHVKKYL